MSLGRVEYTFYAICASVSALYVLVLVLTGQDAAMEALLCLSLTNSFRIVRIENDHEDHDEEGFA